MRVQDLKVGMVLEIEDAEEKTLVMVCDSKHGKCVSGKKNWFPIDCFDENLRYLSAKVTKVYDICNNALGAYKLSTTDRKLLWKRKKEARFAEKVTITADEMMDVCAKSIDDFISKNPIRIGSVSDLLLLSGCICAKLFDDEKEEK